METAIIYDFLLILMTLFLFFSGWLISNKISSYWSAASIGILAYSLNVGLRFGRGFDYNVYVDVFNLIAYGIDTDHEILFVSAIKLVSSLGGTWPVFVFLMSLLFVFSIYVFLQNFRKYAIYCLPIFPYFTMFSENIVRQTMGLSFLLIGMYFLLRKNRSIIFYIFFAILACLSHSVSLVFAVIFFLISLKEKTILSPKFSIIAFFLILLLFRTENLMFFSSIFVYLMAGEHYEQYVNNIDFWLQKGSEESVSYTVTALYLFVVYFGYKIKLFFGKNYSYIYNLFLIGFLIYPISAKIELVSRIGVVLEMFVFVLLGCLFIYFIKYKRLYSHLGTFAILCLFSLNLLRVYIVTPFKNPVQYQYLWDANGREKIEITDFRE